MGLRSRLLHALHAGHVKDKGINMGLPLVTKAEYKAYQGISSTTSDSAIEILIPKVSELVKSICRRTFVDYIDDAKIEYSDGGTNSIELTETPVISVSSLEYSTDYGKTYEVLEEYTHYVFARNQNNLRPLLMNTRPLEVYSGSPYGNTNYGYMPYGTTANPIFPVAINGYRITYNAGYETIPEDLKLAILDMIAYYIKNDSAIHTHKLASPNTMQIEYISNTHFPAHIKRILDLYTSSYN
jgi:hypothetical protein